MDDTQRPPTAAHPDVAWKTIVANYQHPHAGRASWQLVNTLGSYAGVWALMYFTVQSSWLLTLLLAVLAGGLLIRTFIIFHDCGHGSFFASPVANDVWGYVTGLLTFTPYYHWRGEHAIHHGTTGQLDRRGVGDIWTMTVEEYLQASRWRRFAYRLARNPVVLFALAPLTLFLLIQRWPRRGASARERHSVWWMNLLIAAMVGGLGLLYGFVPYLLIQLTVLAVATSVGVWLFYLQHQFEEVYWERGEHWDFRAAALQGSSYLKLPRILQWFSGNIGFHHVHHLSPRIPNYNLQRCHDSEPLFQTVRPITLWGSLRSLGLRLWDESARKLVGFRRIRARRRGGGTGAA